MFDAVNTLSVSEWTLGAASTSEAIDRVAAAGYPAIEIAAGPELDLRAARERLGPSAGTRDQFETDGWEIPMRRASSVTPPTARIACSSPGSLMDTPSMRVTRAAEINSFRLWEQLYLGTIAATKFQRGESLVRVHT